METQRTPADEEIILKKIERQLMPAYRVGYCVAGHDTDHIRRMIRIAEIISDPKEVSLFLLKVAIWFHNTDRSSFFDNYSENEIIKLIIENTLSSLRFTEEEITQITDAVRKHSHLNDESDSMLLRYLKDCDRLDMGAIGILRIPALRGNELPIYTPADFLRQEERSTAEKDLTSMLHDLDRCLEWEDMLRIPRAREFGKKRFAFMKQFREEVKRELEELGII